MKHVVVNKVVEDDVQEGYLQRLSKGQATGVAELEKVRDKSHKCVCGTRRFGSVTLVKVSGSWSCSDVGTLWSFTTFVLGLKASPRDMCFPVPMCMYVCLYVMLCYLFIPTFFH